MKANRIRLYYGIFLSLLTAALGAFFIAQSVVILADGNWQQGAYNSEIVAEKLFPVSIVLYIWIAAVIAGFVLSLYYPYKEKTVKVFNENSVRRRLAVRTPQGSGEEYDSKMQRVHLEQRNRFIVYIVCAAVCFAAVIASGVYLLKSSNFASHDKSESMLNMLINVGPWVLIGFLACLFTTFFEKFSITREITVLKQLIASNKGNPVISADKSENKVWLKIKAFFAHKYTKLGVRIGVGIIGVTFVLVGIFDTEGARDVLLKAINICTECIGLG